MSQHFSMAKALFGVFGLVSTVHGRRDVRLDHRVHTLSTESAPSSNVSSISINGTTTAATTTGHTGPSTSFSLSYDTSTSHTRPSIATITAPIPFGTGTGHVPPPTGISPSGGISPSAGAPSCITSPPHVVFVTTTATVTIDATSPVSNLSIPSDVVEEPPSFCTPHITMPASSKSPPRPQPSDGLPPDEFPTETEPEKATTGPYGSRTWEVGPVESSTDSGGQLTRTLTATKTTYKTSMHIAQQTAPAIVFGGGGQVAPPAHKTPPSAAQGGNTTPAPGPSESDQHRGDGGSENAKGGSADHNPGSSGGGSDHGSNGNVQGGGSGSGNGIATGHGGTNDGGDHGGGDHNGNPGSGSIGGSILGGLLGMLPHAGGNSGHGTSHGGGDASDSGIKIGDSGAGHDATHLAGAVIDKVPVVAAPHQIVIGNKVFGVDNSDSETQTVMSQAFTILPHGSGIVGPGGMTVAAPRDQEKATGFATIGGVQFSAAPTRPAEIEAGGSTFMIPLGGSAQIEVSGSVFTVGPTQVFSGKSTATIPGASAAPAPDFTATTIDGVAVALGSHLAVVGGSYTVSIGKGATSTAFVVDGATITAGSGGVAFASRTVPPLSASRTVTANGMTFEVGASVVDVDGKTYSFAHPTQFVVGSQTVSIGTNGVELPSTTIPAFTATETKSNSNSTGGTHTASTATTAAATTTDKRLEESKTTAAASQTNGAVVLGLSAKLEIAGLAVPLGLAYLL